MEGESPGSDTEAYLKLSNINPQQNASDSRPYGEIRIKDNRYTALLDCGAVLSYMSEKTVNRVRPLGRSRLYTASVYLDESAPSRRN